MVRFYPILTWPKYTHSIWWSTVRLFLNLTCFPACVQGNNNSTELRTVVAVTYVCNVMERKKSIYEAWFIIVSPKRTVQNIKVDIYICRIDCPCVCTCLCVNADVYNMSSCMLSNKIVFPCISANQRQDLEPTETVQVIIKINSLSLTHTYTRARARALLALLLKTCVCLPFCLKYLFNAEVCKPFCHANIMSRTNYDSVRDSYSDVRTETRRTNAQSEFRMVFMRSENPIRTPPCLLEVSATLPLKQFQCSSDWQWPSLVLSVKIVECFLSLRHSSSGDRWSDVLGFQPAVMLEERG